MGAALRLRRIHALKFLLWLVWIVELFLVTLYSKLYIFDPFLDDEALSKHAQCIYQINNVITKKIEELVLNMKKNHIFDIIQDLSSQVDLSEHYSIDPCSKDGVHGKFSEVNGTGHKFIKGVLAALVHLVKEYFLQLYSERYLAALEEDFVSGVMDGVGVVTVGITKQVHQVMELTEHEVEFRRISLTGFRSCISRSHYQSVSKQTTRHKFTRWQSLRDDEMRLCLVDDLKKLKITYSHTSQLKGTSSNLKSMITTPYSQENEKEKEGCKHKNEDLHSMLVTTPTPSTTPLTTEVQATTLTATDLSPTVFLRLSELERKVEALSKVDHSEVIKESVQANVRLKALFEKYSKRLQLFLLNLLLLLDNLLPEQLTIANGESNLDKVLRKRHCDKDQDPIAGSDKEKKRKRKVKDYEPSKDTTQTGSSKGKTPPKTSKTDKSVTVKELVKEPIHEVAMDVEEPILDDVVNDVDQPQHDINPKNDKSTWFKQSPRPKTPDPEWNKDKNVDDGLEQTRFNDPVNAEKDSHTFDELMASTIDFTKFSMNHLKLDNITKVDLVGPVYKLLKGTYKSSIELAYNMDQCYNALTDQLDWTNPEGDRCPYDLKQLFNLLGDDIVDLVNALRMFTQSLVIKKRVKDVQLGVESYQKKLNITKPQKEFPGISYKEAYTTSYDPKEVVYLNSRKQKRLMRVNELYKFSDGTFNSVHKILHYRLLNLSCDITKTCQRENRQIRFRKP
ncbi:hypothetical protein Tco_0427906 [Tanacetum coccineum]